MRTFQFLAAGLALVITCGCTVDRCGSGCHRDGFLARIFSPRNARQERPAPGSTCGCDLCQSGLSPDNAANEYSGLITSSAKSVSSTLVPSNDCGCDYIAYAKPAQTIPKLQTVEVAQDVAVPRPEFEEVEQPPKQTRLADNLPKVEPIKSNPVMFSPSLGSTQDSTSDNSVVNKSLLAKSEVPKVEVPKVEPVENEGQVLANVLSDNSEKQAPQTVSVPKYEGVLTPFDKPSNPIAEHTPPEPLELPGEYKSVDIAPAEPPRKQIKALSVSSTRVLEPTPVEPSEESVYELEVPDNIDVQPFPNRVVDPEEAIEDATQLLPAKGPAYQGPIVLKAKVFEGSIPKVKPATPERFAQRGEDYYKIGADQLRQVPMIPKMEKTYFENLPPVDFGTIQKAPVIQRLPILEVPMSGESRNEQQLRGEEEEQQELLDLEARLVPIRRTQPVREISHPVQWQSNSVQTEIVRLQARPADQVIDTKRQSVARFTMREMTIVPGEQSLLKASSELKTGIPALAEQVKSVDRLLNADSDSETIDR